MSQRMSSILPTLLGARLMVIILRLSISLNESPIIEYSKGMAFVYREEKKHLSPSETPGPGQYESRLLQKNIPPATAPFNHASVRKLWTENRYPGPGTYELSHSQFQETALLQNTTENIIIYQSPKETNQFLSGTKRFKEQKEVGPGPGQYGSEKQRKIQRKSPQSTHKLRNLVMDLHRIQREEISFNGPMLSTQHIPRQNEMLCKSRKQITRNTTAFSSNVSRETRARPITSAGPGTYNLNDTNRPSYTRINCRNENICPINSHSLNLFFPDANQVGPGSYYREELHSAFKKREVKKGEDYFGSKATRFVREQNSVGPGPASYTVENKNVICNSFKMRPQTAKTDYTFVKGNYKSPLLIGGNTVMQKPILQGKDKKEDVKCPFGSKEERFKSTIQEKAAAPQQIILKLQELSGEKKSSKQFHKFHRLNVKRSLKVQKENIESLKLESNFFLNPMFQNQKLIVLEAENPRSSQKHYEEREKQKRIQVKAPFMSHSHRFENDIAWKNIPANIQAEKIPQNPIQKRQRINTKKIRNPRLKRETVKRSSVIQDCRTYDPILPHKKQFNTLFL